MIDPKLPSSARDEQFRDIDAVKGAVDIARANVAHVGVMSGARSL